eukprot:2928716-Prymnesium_polylepis.1
MPASRGFEPRSRSRLDSCCPLIPRGRAPQPASRGFEAHSGYQRVEREKRSRDPYRGTSMRKWTQAS